MIQLKVGCELDFQVNDITTLILMLRPLNGAQQSIISDVYTVTPEVPVIESTDIYGNLYQRLVAYPGEFSVRTTSEVITSAYVDVAPGACFVEIQNLSALELPYLLPSRYCESDRFGEFTAALVADALPGYDQVNKIVEWVHHSIQYLPGSSDIPVSAVEVHNRGYGVCRDLAQLGIALCRSISIPARLVVGYLHNLDPMDLHAWFEAYVGGRWYTFDPTQSELRGGRVIIAFGRDAADVSVFHQFGSGCQLMQMNVRVERVDDSLSTLL